MFSSKYTYRFEELSVPEKALSTNDHSLCLSAVRLVERLMKVCKQEKGKKRVKRGDLYR